MRIPIGDLTPVETMSMRARMGGTQRDASPGSFTRLSSSSMIFAIVMPGRHSLSGLRWIVVSSISSGAESVAVSARPALPKTESTSGTDLMRRSVV